jgi:hypothetical protein
MLTETEARHLLQQAADTIEVAPAALPQPTRGRRRHVILGAAAAAALIAGGLGLAGLQRHGSTPVAPTPGDRVSVPSVFGYDVTGAGRLVTAAGLHPVTHRLRTCGEVSGRALRTRPAAGTRLSAGSSVTLVVAAGGLPCPGPVPPFADREQPWRLVDLATGSGPTPSFADRVVLRVNHQKPVTVSGVAAVDPDAWPVCDSTQPACPGSALDVIGYALAHPLTAHGKPITPRLLTGSTRTGDVFFSIGYAFNGSDVFARWEIVERIDRSGDVAAVRLTYDGSSDPTSASTAAGSVTGPDPDGIGHRFVDFARGNSDSLPIDTPVALYLGHQRVATTGDGDSSVRASWRVCRQYAGRICPFSALDTLASYDGPLRLADHPATPAPCLATLVPTPPTDAGGTHVAVVLPAGTTTCLDGFEVDVYSNDVGQIVAVDLVLSEP